jgi:pyruvate dehydrogenase E2 component (dihydrolipoamide acetyltransferase)
VNLTYLPFIARAVIDALKIHPNVNASYSEDTKEITYYDAEHLGFAVDTEQGLLSPVIHNAGDLLLGGRHVPSPTSPRHRLVRVSIST